MYKFYSDEVKKSVIEDYEDGMKVADIEKRHGIPKGSIGHMLTEAGVPRRRNRNAPPQKKMSELREGIERTNRTFLLLVWHSDSDGKRKDHQNRRKHFPDGGFLPGNTAGRRTTGNQGYYCLYQRKLQRVIPWKI